MSALRPVRTGWWWLLLVGAALSGCGWVDSGVGKNKPPVPADDVYTIPEGLKLQVNAAEGVLANDTDGGSKPLTATLVQNSGPSHAASFEFHEDGSFIYAHDGGESTEDSFSYTASDGIKTSIPKVVKINISPVNDQPTITGQDVTPLVTAEDTPIDVRSHLVVTDPDSTYPDDFTVLVASGTNYTASGSVVTPAANYNGSLSVAVSVEDNGGLFSKPITLAIKVTPVNDAPVITGQQTLTTAEDTPLTLALGNLTVFDPDNAYPNNFTLAVQAGAHYTVTGTKITPAANYYGTLTVPVTVNDGAATSSVFNLAVNVTAVNDAPVITGQSALSTAEDTPLTLTPGKLAVSDPDNAYPADFTLAVQAGANYTVTGTSPTFTITPAANYYGALTVPVTVNDGTATSSPFNLAVTVTAVNDVPVITAQSPLSTAEDTPLAIALADLTVTDPDNTYPDDFTLAVQAGANYTVAGTTITPAANYNGPLTVPVTVKDGAATSAPFNLAVTVTAVNDAPVANGDTNGVIEDNASNVVTGNLRANDTDVEDATDLLEITEFNGTPTPATVTGTYGSLSLDVDGSYIYTLDNADPDTNGLAAGEVGSDAFTYTLQDTEGATSTATLTVSVTGANDAPVITGQNPVSTPEDTPLGITLAHLVVSDPDDAFPSGFTLAVQGGANYTVSGTTITPASNYNGTLSVPVTVNDGAANSPVFDLKVTVTAVNDAPVITGQTPVPLSTPEDTPLIIALANLTVTDLDNAYPADFTLTVQGGANYTKAGTTITPAANYSGPLTVPVKVNDGTDDSAVFNLAVTVTAVNDAPVITSNDGGATAAISVVENQTAVTTVTAIDVENDTLTYSISGGADAAKFSIGASNGVLTFVSAPNFSAPTDVGGNNVYDVQVTVTDGTLTDEQTIAVTVTNVNDPPTDIALSPTSVAENQSSGTPVGSFSTTDPDIGDTHTYSLVTGTGDTDNGSFSIVGSELRTAASFDYETKSSYSVRVRTTDSGGATVEKAFTIAVTNANDAPINIALSATNVAENQPAGTVVGSFSTTDPDIGDTHTYTLVTGTGDADNGSFSIVGNALRTAASFDYETKNSYSIRVRTTDNGTPSASFEKQFTITVTNVNDAPVITSNDGGTTAAISVPENQTAVTTVTATDADGNTLSYSITGGADSAKFSIGTSSGVLAFLSAPSYVVGGDNVYDVQVTVTDGTLTDGQTIAVTVTNVNDPPTDIALSPTSVAENQPSGTVVGTFSTTDQDSSDTHTYALVTGTGDTDNGSFSIVGSELRTAASFDFETKNSYNIRVRSTDSGTPSASFEKQFTITVDNANDAPTNITLSATNVAENQPAGTVVGTFSSTDQDTDTHTYTLVTGTGDADNGSFSIVGSELRTAASFDFETKNSYSIRVRSTDSGTPSASFEKQFTITVDNANDAPTNITLSATNVAENQPSGTVVGTFSTTDQDSSDTHTYALVTGTGDTDNGSFSIVGSELRTAASFDFETKSSYSIRVRSTDSGTPSASFEKQFTITVDNVNDAPVITSNGGGATAAISVEENQTAVTTVTATDADGDTLTYNISGGADQAKFSIGTSSGVLTFASAPSFASPTDANGDNVYEVQVTVTDNGAGSLTDVQAISVTVTEAVGAGSSTLTIASGGCWTTPQEQALTATLPAEATLTPPLAYFLTTDGTKGSVTLEPTGQFTYTPSLAAPRGRDTFTYTVEGVLGNTLTRTATVIVDARVMALGDSVTTGITDAETDPANPTPAPAERGGYRKPLYDALAAAGYGVDLVGTQAYGTGLAAFDPDNEGHEGWSASELASGTTSTSGIYYWLTRNPADVVLLHVGTDVLTPLADDAAAILNAIDRWEGDTGHTVTVILARIIDHNPPDANGDVTTFNNDLQALAEARIANGDSLVIVDQQSALWGADNLPNPAFYGDTLHPNATGYAKMGNVWFGALSPRLDKCP